MKEKEKLKGWKEIPIGAKIEKAGSALDFKTGTWRTFRPVWNSKKCIHCQFCTIYCPDMCILVKDDTKQQTIRLETDFDFCKGCGICAKECPVKCIEMKPEGDFK